MFRKGQNGVSTNGVAANLMFSDRGTFGVLPLTYFCLPKIARAYLFLQPVDGIYFSSGPISAEPRSRIIIIIIIMIIIRRRKKIIIIIISIILIIIMIVTPFVCNPKIQRITNTWHSPKRPPFCEKLC